MGSGMGPMAMTAPVDEGTVMDGVRNPMCSEYPKDDLTASRTTAPRCTCTAASRPWISDGTPHQWITPAGENTDVAAGRQRRGTCPT